LPLPVVLNQRDLVAVQILVESMSSWAWNTHHTQIKTTQRYAHLAPETLLAASNAATKAVGSIMGVMPNRVVDVPLVAVQG